MLPLAPIPESEAQDKTAQTYGRIRDMFAGGEIPAPFLLMGNVPAFLGDFYMNFKKFIWTPGHLTEQQKATIGLATAAHFRSPVWMKYLGERCLTLGFPEAHIADTLAVVATCQMYNAFFKFRDLSGTDRFSGMSVGLRAHTFTGTSLDEPLVELINIAISDLNGCKPCTTGHIDRARELGHSDEALLETVQCAATMAAGCAFINYAAGDSCSS